MAKGKSLGFGKTGKKKKSKDAIPQEDVDRISLMKPEDLAIELSREQLQLESLQQQMKEDTTLTDYKKVVDDLENRIKTEDDVVQATAALESIKDDHRNSTEYKELDDAKQNLKAEKHGWNVDVKKRKKLIKFMMKTLRHHIDSGALKFKN